MERSQEGAALTYTNIGKNMMRATTKSRGCSNSSPREARGSGKVVRGGPQRCIWQQSRKRKRHLPLGTRLGPTCRKGSVTIKPPRWKPDAISPLKTFLSKLAFLSDGQFVCLDNRGLKNHPHEHETFWTVLKFLTGAVFTTSRAVYIILDINYWQWL